MAEQTGAAQAQDEGPQFTPAERGEYVAAVIAKQCGLPADEAAKRAKALKPEQFDQVHDAGRAGDVATVRELLGC